MQSSSRDSTCDLRLAGLTPLWRGGVQVQFEHRRSSHLNEAMHTHTRKKEDLSADRASSFVRKRKHEKKRVVYYKEQKSKRAKREKERERERDGWMMLKQSIGQKCIASTIFLCVCECREFLVFYSYSRSFSFICTFSKSLSNIILSNFYSARFSFFCNRFLTLILDLTLRHCFEDRVNFICIISSKLKTF